MKKETIREIRNINKKAKEDYNFLWDKFAFRNINTCMCKFPWKCYLNNSSDRLSSIALTFILITLHIRHSKDFTLLAYLASFYENSKCFCLMNTCNMFILEYTAQKIGVWEIFSKLFFFFFFNLQYCIGFAIHWHESATGVLEYPILNPPPTFHPILSLWVIPVHQPQASCILYQT